MRTSKFVKDAGMLISGNVWAQVVALVSYLVLTRLYSPEDFAVFNVFYSYVEVLIILSTCKYEAGIVAAPTLREATALSQVAGRLNLMVSLAVLAVMGVISLSQRPLDAQGWTMLILLPPMIYFCGTSRIYSGLFNRARQYKEITTSEVVNSTSGALLKIAAAFPEWVHSSGLPLGTVAGRGLGNLCYRRRLGRLNLPDGITREERRTIARKNRNYPLYAAPKDLINSFSYNLPFLWLAACFEKPEVGLFALALTFTFRPVNVLNNAFEKILYARFSEKVRSRQPLGQDLRRFLLFAGLGTLPLFVAAWIFAEPLFGFVFGSRWTGAGYYVRLLLPWVYVALMSTSLMFLPNIFSKQRTEFCFYLVMLVGRVLSMVAGIITHNFATGILWFAVSSMAVSVLLLIWYLSMARRYDKEILR